MNRRHFLALPLLGLAGCSRRESRVVVYCAQDQEFAEGVFADFTRDTGLAVAPKYDTEANKSVSLAAELEREVSRPRCDVHWNNEPVGTVRLARKGVYERYDSPNAAPFPHWIKAQNDAGTWHAFACRARVLIANTQLVPEADRPRGLFDLLHPRFKDRLAMAKPAFGTTASHAAFLFDALGGPDAAKEFFTNLKANGVQIVAGNKQVATGVSEGRFAVGLTDTDDALTEVKACKPVAVVFPDWEANPRHPALRTLFLPNTVAVVKGGPNPDGARKLVDYLLRPETEQRLIESGASQFPLNPAAAAKPLDGPFTPRDVKPTEVDFARVADRWEDSQRFLAELFGS
jgi:iron(III) transport system substrate-binding protein